MKRYQLVSDLEAPLGDYIPVIGLMAEDRAGKDTVADMLVEKGWLKVAFADRLKAAVHALDARIKVPFNGSMKLNVALERWGEDWVKENCPEYRELLINFGTKTLREHMGLQYIWIDSVLQYLARIDRWDEVPKGVIITDVRDPLETIAVAEELGGYIVELRSSRGRGHYATEEQLAVMRPRVSHVISNNGTLEDLQLEVDRLESLIMKEYNGPEADTQEG